MKKLTHSIFAAVLFGMTLLPGPAIAERPYPPVPKVVQRRYYNCLQDEATCEAQVYNDQIDPQDWCWDEIYDNGDITYHGWCYD